MGATSYRDVVCGREVAYTGVYATGSGIRGRQRRFRRLLHGMLVEAEVNMIFPKKFIPFDYEDSTDEEDETGSESESEDEELEDYEVPDLVSLYWFEDCGPYNEKELRDYMVLFTDTVIPLLKLEGSDSEVFIRKNLERVVSYLVALLEKRNLKFYKVEGAEETPEEDGASLIFGDFSNPREPVLLFPDFGLMAKTAGMGYVPWKPCQDETSVLDTTLVRGSCTGLASASAIAGKMQ